MIYHEIDAAFHMDVIRDAIEDVKQVVKSHKRRKKTLKKLESQNERLKRKGAQTEISVQTDLTIAKQ